MNEIVKRIDELRKKKGLTKKKLMKKMGISSSTFNNWFYEDTIPSLSNIENVCNALDITTEQFFSGLGNENGKRLGEEFLDEWRMLSDTQKTAVLNVIQAFKELRKGGAK